MPASHYELFDALDLVADVSKANVLIVTNSQENDAFINVFTERIGTSKGLTFINQWQELQSAQHHDRYDAAIVNKVMVDSKIVDDCKNLEVFIKCCLNALKYNAFAIVREDLSSYQATDKVAGLTAMFDVYRVKNVKKDAGFDFKSLKQLDDSIHTKQNFLDVFWTLSKQEFDHPTGDAVTFRDFLDKTQYTDTGIFAYEWIFGENFISPGGAAENLKILKRYGTLKPGQTMLDIGVGIGGGARQAAEEFGLHVHGIDLSSNMLSISMDRLQQKKDSRVRYTIANALDIKLAPETYDLVLSRDCLQHNDDMGTMMKNIYKWLKPGGRVLITMYGKGHGTFSPKFETYVTQRQYYLKTLEEMVQLTKEAGFSKVEGKNLTPRFEEILQQELNRAIVHKTEFLKKFSEEKYAGLINGWNDKLVYIKDDNHNWIQIFGVKL